MFYIFVSYQLKIIEHYNIISNIMIKLNHNSYAIFYGGENKHISNNHIIHIDCDDTYEGLPNKIHNICRYISLNFELQKFSHFCKIDSTTPLVSLVPILSNKDYYGSINSGDGDRGWHLKKTSNHSKWKTKLYTGEYIPYCLGGAYVLSRKAVNCVAKFPNCTDTDIYEDLYVAQQLIKCEIYPYQYDIKQHLFNNRW